MTKKRKSGAADQAQAAAGPAVGQSPSAAAPSAAAAVSPASPQKKGKKAKQDSVDPAHAALAAGGAASLIPGKAKGRNYTISLAVPGSILAAEVAAVHGGGGRPKGGHGHGHGSHSTPAAALAAAAAIVRQVAAAAMAGCMDEVVIYDDSGSNPSASGAPGSDAVSASVSPACAFLAQGLQYLETPPYLRKALCPVPPSVAAALDATGAMHAPHHPGQTDWHPFREGVVLKTDPPAEPSGQGHCFVDVGLDRMAFVPQHLPRGARVTLSLGEQATTSFVPEYSETMIIAEVVSPITPRVQYGMYRGYDVRLASSLHAVVKACPYSKGYDLTIGTSANGILREQSDLVLPRYSHALLVFGGASKDLGEIMQEDQPLQDKSPEDYFNMYLNLCPLQGTSSIRTEDAVLMALGYLRPALLQYGGNVGQS